MNEKFDGTLQKYEIEKLIDEHTSQSTDYTRYLSSIFRQIAFSEGSLFWFLKSQLNVSLISILIGLLLVLMFFICDALQYYNGYSKYNKEAIKFQKNLEDDKYHESDYVDSLNLHLAITLPFKIKLLCLVAATIFLIVGFVAAYQGYVKA